jgi:uncharacterized protein YjbI with pentapeptide repeats
MPITIKTTGPISDHPLILNLDSLNGADLSGRDLRWTRFNEMDLTGADLRNADLRHT